MSLPSSDVGDHRPHTCVSGAGPGKAPGTPGIPAPWAGSGRRSGASPEGKNKKMNS